MFDFHKPDWLYEALPYVYVLAGIATITNLGNVLSMVSGGLLVSAGLFIWWMRRTYRRTQKRQSVDRRAGDQWTAAERRAAQRRETARRDTERQSSRR